MEYAYEKRTPISYVEENMKKKPVSDTDEKLEAAVKEINLTAGMIINQLEKIKCLIQDLNLIKFKLQNMSERIEKEEIMRAIALCEVIEKKKDDRGDKEDILEQIRVAHKKALKETRDKG